MINSDALYKIGDIGKVVRLKETLVAVVLSMFAAVVMVSTNARAQDDTTREYYGYDRAAGATLTVTLTGSILSGLIKATDWDAKFSGASNGSNMANVRVTLRANGKTQDGFMILRWHPQGIKASLIIKGNRELSGLFPFATDRQ